ncbi:MAG: 2OG-Fe(II) oxygenase [Chitinophaga sp.]|uniref:2OG-Fe(II) oxygenase n=1 Tax=Chitinophaga sp. TaxID=1869181 RepID=UPI0025C45690|nr:2OG-Fe(II) oxygenase [Chitinophaga sp.]MBV8251785.1 2OG-Fe(II) oxygenase [Chitinophaga sp.]
MKVHHYSPEIFTISNFFTKEECQHLIDRSEALGYEEAKVDVGGGKQQMIKGIRNNERVMFTDDTYVEWLWERVAPFAPEGKQNRVACGLNELLRFYRYTPGQRFKMHMDGSYIRNPSEASQYTFLIYLNDGYEGGETVFHSGEVVQPEAGSALIFYHPLRHEGSLLHSGMKYVLRTDIMYKDI